jgi:TatD DNase family protein
VRPCGRKPASYTCPIRLARGKGGARPFDKLGPTWPDSDMPQLPPSPSSDAPVSASVPPPLIDAHCHLERATYGDELPDVLGRARAAGVEAFIAVGASGITRGADEAAALAQAHDDVYASVGIHPCEVHEASDADMAHIERLLGHPRVVSLGEVGLDYYHDASTAPVQKARFGEFVAMAKRTRRVLMLHIRDAHDDCLALLDAHGVPEAGAMIHCFTAGPDVARAYLERGLYLSIPGVVTFKNAVALQEAVPHIPAGRLLLETDCPYLTPVPHRGKRNEPALVRHTGEAVAALRQVPYAELARGCANNARTLFGLGARPEGA